MEYLDVEFVVRVIILAILVSKAVWKQVLIFRKIPKLKLIKKMKMKMRLILK